jgi:dsDNA-binding SOS-regulon protein
MAASNPTFNNAAFSDFGGAASDLFAAQGDKSKQQFDYAEASNYELGANLADQNAQFTQTSTAIKEAQQQRELTMNLGATTATAAGSGFAASGSSLDILRESASQGALTHAVLGQQGLITEAGYKEQAQSYNTMATAATQAGNAEGNAATGADITGGIKIAAGIASIFAAPLTGGASLAVGGAALSAVGDPNGIGGLY